MFDDREQAGRLLAEKMLRYKRDGFGLVFGIPRGGVPVAKVISEKLDLPMDVLISRKIGAPNQKELAIGAVGPAGVKVLDNELIEKLNVSDEYLSSELKIKKEEIKDRQKKFGSRNLNVKGKNIILVDDGIATGATVEVAIKFLRKLSVKKIILAVPVAPHEAKKKLKKLVDELIILKTPTFFHAVGQFYRNFPQVSNEEVKEILSNVEEQSLYITLKAGS